MSRIRPVTKRQAEILAWFRAFTEREGVPPSVREVGAGFQITARAAYDHVHALVRKGVLRRRDVPRGGAHAFVLASPGPEGPRP